MPAAAVIPAPGAYVNVVAVKKLVVGLVRCGGMAVFVQKGVSICLVVAREIFNWMPVACLVARVRRCFG